MSNQTVVTEITDYLRGFTEEFANEFLTRVKDRTPVRTGRLRDGFEMDIGPTHISITTDVPYYEYVEYGTPLMAPRRMVTRTIEEAEQIATEIVGRT